MEIEKLIKEYFKAKGVFLEMVGIELRDLSDFAKYLYKNGYQLYNKESKEFLKQ